MGLVAKSRAGMDQGGCIERLSQPRLLTYEDHIAPQPSVTFAEKRTMLGGYGPEKRQQMAIQAHMYADSFNIA